MLLRLLTVGIALIAMTPALAEDLRAGHGLDSARAAMMTDPAAALMIARRAEQISATISDVREREIAIAVSQIVEADALTRLDRLDQAGPLAVRALATLRRRAAGNKLLGDALVVNGAIYNANGDLAAALRDYQVGYTRYQQAGAAREEAATLLRIGSLYGVATDYATALKYIDQASAIYRGEPRLQLAIYANRAAALQDIGRYAESEVAYRKALVLARSMKSVLLEARLLGNIAGARLKLNDVAGAQRALAEAFGLARQGEAAGWRPQLIAIRAQAAYQQHAYAEAAALIRERFAGVDLATTAIPFREAHETAYDTYRATGDTALALAHLAALKRLDDQATRLATSANAALATARFDFANQELKLATVQRDDANRKAELEHQRARTQRLVFLLVGGAAAIVTVLLAFGVVTLRRSRDKVRAVAADLAVTNQALGKALAAKTEFLATTSHEIRTPLNGILGMTQVMLADPRLTSETRERIGVVHGAGVTMRALVDDILDVAKMETGNLTVEQAPFDLRATLADAARLWEEQARGKGVGFSLDLAECPGMIEGDAARVRQIVFNLLSNALKFTAEGQVGLRASHGADEYRLAVSDTGIGIAPDQREAIFESFRQADAGTTRQFGGTGLGLSICRNLAQAMGGDVALSSVVGEGSTFTVTLPLVAVAGPVAAAEAAATTRHGVLVIDANPIGRATLAALVGKRCAEVATFASLDEAAGAEAEHAVVDQGAIAGLADPAAGLTALRARVDSLLLLWKGDCPPVIAAAVSRVVAKPVGGNALLSAVFGGGMGASSPSPLVRRAA